jgi:hypothetical protein
VNRSVKPVCLVAGLLSNREQARAEVMYRLTARFGEPFFISAPLPFTYSDYYTAEMGPGLDRRFMVFGKTVKAEDLALIKLRSNSLENDFRERGRRLVNIDPGLLGPGNFILATTKANAHRLPLGQGIYGELTLWLQHGAFQPLPWTYPDYASPLYRQLFLSWRNRYLSLILEGKMKP